MTDSVEEAMAEAVAELKTHSWVIDAIWNEDITQDKPGNYVKKSIHLFHKPKGAGATWTTVDVYVIKAPPFEWVFHYNLPTMDSNTATSDFFKGILPTIKAAMDFDFIEIDAVDEEKESIVLTAIKTNTGNEADTYTIKAWKTGETTCDYKIIKKTTVI